MKQLLLLFGLWSLCTFTALCQSENRYCFRIYLKDKGDISSYVDRSTSFLSQRAVERRQKDRIAITESDYPISQDYLDRLQIGDARIVAKSKWMRTVVVATADSSLGERLRPLPFVDSVCCVWKGKIQEPLPWQTSRDRLPLTDGAVRSHYGYAEKQIKLLNGIRLHRAGFTGRGVSVAVIDAGFSGVDRMAFFDSLHIAGTHNLVCPEESVFEGDEHGTKVLSCIAANLPGVMVGTAPDATYWLLKSEDGRSEYPVEEDYWAAAVEYADSVGVTVISSSLGYYTFDEEAWSHTQQELDGHSALVSRVAQMAADKGLLLFCSAGNEGNSDWGTITFPADAVDIVSVGAVDDKRRKSVFSSVGYTADGRVKPDVVAMGSGCCIVDSRGTIRYGNGTSFATPILAGLSICLWQAFPQLSNKELIRQLRMHASQARKPDPELGYGLPDFYKLYKQLRHEYR
ncbi:MAG: S8 family peptidase [Parabacteroides sp.]